MYRKKTTVIIVMCVMMLFMGIGYALLSTKLDINGGTSVTSTWKVEFSAIRVKTGSTKGGATSKSSSYTSTTANFEVDLVQPGDELTYEIDITNYGDIKAEVKGATYTSTDNDAIYIRIENIRKGTTIESCEGLTTCPTHTMTVTVGYNPAVEKDPTSKTKEIGLTLNIGQYVASAPTADGELIPDAYEKLVTKILSNNTTIADTNIDFSKISSNTNGTGLYYTSTNTEDNKTTYYFRGAVENNYVSFAGFTWRIVRINEDGSVRLIKQDSIGVSVFNNFSNDNAYVGYMYGTAGATTYEATHINTNSSAIKSYLDIWYQNNLVDYSSYLADSGFCGDRSIDSEALGYGTTSTSYGSHNRLMSKYIPQFKCPQENDLYTTSSATKGNKALTYPIGLITADEVAYAGALYSRNNDEFYLKNNEGFWTMTPDNYSGAAFVWAVGISGITGQSGANSGSFNARPVINLKSTVTVLSGDGTKTNPYLVK